MYGKGFISFRFQLQGYFIINFPDFALFSTVIDTVAILMLLK